MATRIERILDLARITLADKAKERWTDDDLLLILNEGHKDLCRHTQLLHNRALVDVRAGEPYITLPEDCWLVTRVEWGDDVLRPITYNQLDRNPNFSPSDFGFETSTDWQSDKGMPEAYIYDHRNLLELRLYPEPDDSIYDVVYSFAGGADFVGGEVFGVVTGIDEYTFDSPYGVVTDLFDPNISTDTLADDYGVVTDLQQTNNSLKVYYVANPVDVEAITDELQTPYMFDTALKYYVAGHAFLNDLDTGYQQKGQQQLGLYDRELSVAAHTQVRDGTRTGAFETSYRRGV